MEGNQHKIGYFLRHTPNYQKNNSQYDIICSYGLNYDIMKVTLKIMIM